MMCGFFFVSVTTFWNMGLVSDRKVNVVGTLGGGGQNVMKNLKKSNRKTGIFTQNQFSTKSIFLYGCKSKTNHCKYLKFSLKAQFFLLAFEVQILTKVRQNHEYFKLFCSSYELKI
ncbi:hypothetical protein FWK35_00021005 [Aphis craccivora]|uniref:Uncharacterized protein n=1 Tax=Aphis craccivora TaxID=307492 RepID=A0A6G0Y084_APHCR|nr:hypothetical protein FWK35_00021005 [Aphis craccivora]